MSNENEIAFTTKEEALAYCEREGIETEWDEEGADGTTKHSNLEHRGVAWVVRNPDRLVAAPSTASVPLSEWQDTNGTPDAPPDSRSWQPGNPSQ